MDVVIVESNMLGRAHARAAVRGVEGLALVREADELADVEPNPSGEETLLLIGLGHLIEAAESLSRLRPQGFVVIGMWPETSGEVVAEAIRAGVVDVLTQPFSAVALARVLHRDLVDSSSESAGRRYSPTPRQN